MVYYSTSLTLYASEIDPSRNMFIEEIESYLSTLGKTSLDDFKRFTPSASVKVRVSSDGQMAVMPYLMGTWNYAKVVYEPDDKGASQTWYYFVSSIEMVADGTLSIGLELDHVNTFRNWVGAMTDRTFVRRALVSRYWDSRVHFDDMLAPEDVSGEIIKESESILEGGKGFGYLIYDSATDGETHLRFASEKKTLRSCNHIKVTTNGWRKEDFAGLNKGYEYLLEGTALKRITINYQLQSNTSMKTYAYTGNEELVIGCMSGTYAETGGTGTCGVGVYVRIKGQSSTLFSALWPTGTSVSSVYFLELEATGSFTASTAVSSVSPTSKSWDAISVGKEGVFAYSYAKTISSLDRTLSTLVKVIEVPYYPDVGTYGYFMYDSKADPWLWFDDVESQLTTDVALDLTSFDYVQKYPSTRDEAMPLDPKLKTGAFRYAKIVYDAYSTTLAFENFDPFAGASAVLRWTGSASISSSSTFQIVGDFINVEEDYPFLAASERNNELPLYNSDWLNYLRVGYNYDKKSNSMAIATSVMGALSTIALSVTALFSSGATLPAAIGTAVASAGAASGAYAASANVMNAQAAKETQLKNQSASVSSVNDRSLFKAYGSGKAKIEWWAPRADYEALLEHLFFYRGYSINRWMAPDTHAREWFDYLEATPSWNASFVKRTPPQFLNPLAAKVAEGVTIFHAVDDGSGAYAWDLAQEKGNNDL